jgi:hypothetical protein
MTAFSQCLIQCTHSLHRCTELLSPFFLQEKNIKTIHTYLHYLLDTLDSLIHVINVLKEIVGDEYLAYYISLTRLMAILLLLRQITTFRMKNSLEIENPLGSFYLRRIINLIGKMNSNCQTIFFAMKKKECLEPAKEQKNDLHLIELIQQIFTSDNLQSPSKLISALTTTHRGKTKENSNEEDESKPMKTIPTWKSTSFHQQFAAFHVLWLIEICQFPSMNILQKNTLRIKSW